MKKTIAIVLTLILCVGLLAGCGAKDDKTITVAASPTPHAEILAVAKEELAKDGWTLEITEYADYVVPNNVVEDGEIVGSISSGGKAWLLENEGGALKKTEIKSV